MTSDTQSPKRTFLYVFADSSTFVEAKGTSTEKTAPDVALRLAVERLRENGRDEIVIVTGPSKAVRRSLGIKSLPAFALSDRDLEKDGFLDKPQPKLPNALLHPFKRREALKAATFIPTVEREVVCLYESPDALYNFIRDLHIKHLDEDLAAVGSKIEGEVRRLGGRRLMKVVSIGKKLIFPG